MYLTPLEALPRLPCCPPRWKISSADWDLFQSNLPPSLDLSEAASVDDGNALITTTILEAARLSIPQTSSNLPRRPKPWWDDECRESRNRQNCSWARFRRYPTSRNLLAFKQLRAKARYIRKQAKRRSFCSYASSINSFTPAKVVWDRVGRMDGDYRPFSIPLLLAENGEAFSTLYEQANALGRHFAKVSSSENYTPEFLQFKCSVRELQFEV